MSYGGQTLWKYFWNLAQNDIDTNEYIPLGVAFKVPLNNPIDMNEGQ